MLPISSLSSSVHSLTSDSFSSSLIVSIVLLFLGRPFFHHLQFLSNLPQYSSSYSLSDHPNNLFAINLPGNSPLSNIPSSLSCHFTSSVSLLYFFSYSFIASFAFSKFSFPSQVSDSAVNSFHHTRYLSFSLTCCLFNILSTFHSSSPSIMTRASCFFFCPQLALCIYVSY